MIITDDGYEALLLIGERKPKVVFLDIKMPKIDGLQVLELLKSRKKDNSMKIIVLSGYVDTQIREKLSETVADEIWEKGKNLWDLLHSFKIFLSASSDVSKPVSQTYIHAH